MCRRLMNELSSSLVIDIKLRVARRAIYKLQLTLI